MIQPADIPAAPQENDALPAVQPSAETLALLARRRSTKALLIAEPGPDRAQLDTLLRLAARVPDHGKLGPWRFLVLEGDGRVRAGAAIADALGADAPDPAFERARFLRAPVVVTVISTAAPHPKIPEWEQVLSAGAACFALVTAAHAMGFAGCWLTETPTYDARARAALGLADHERIAGFIYLGTATAPPTERARPEAASRTSWF
ncbi:MAG: nitroreductase [Alphaproteobacteria bacterium]|nr:nitroreductase [Alphaproteobacteria bacterium]